MELRGPAVGKASSSVGLFTGNIGAGEGIKRMLILFRTLILVPILFQTALNFQDDSPYNLHCVLSLPPRSRPAQGPTSSWKSCVDPGKVKSFPDTPLPSLLAGPQSLFHAGVLVPECEIQFPPDLWLPPITGQCTGALLMTLKVVES